MKLNMAERAWWFAGVVHFTFCSKCLFFILNDFLEMTMQRIICGPYFDFVHSIDVNL